MRSFNPKAAAAFLRAAHRAVAETLADPAPRMAAMRQRGPALDEKIGLERRGPAVAEVFGLEVEPSSDAIFNTSMLPARSERMILEA